MCMQNGSEIYTEGYELGAVRGHAFGIREGLEKAAEIAKKSIDEYAELVRNDEHYSTMALNSAVTIYNNIVELMEANRKGECDV